MSSFDIPITVAPKDLNRSVASEKLWASTVQPLVNAFGKKYSTTGPFFRASASANVNSFPPMAARAVRSGARAPLVSAACAPPRLRPATAIPIRIMDDLRVIGCLRGRNRAGAESPADAKRRFRMLFRLTPTLRGALKSVKIHPISLTGEPNGSARTDLFRADAQRL